MLPVCMYVVGLPGAKSLKKTDSLSAAANSFSPRGWSFVDVDWLDLEQNLHQVFCAGATAAVSS